MSHLPVLPIIISLFVSFLLPLTDLLCAKARRPLVFVGGLGQLLCIVYLFMKVQHAIIVYNIGGWAPSLGITLVIDQLGSFFLLLISLGTFLIAIYSMGWVETDTGKFFALLFLSLAGMIGIVTTGDLFNMYVFIELSGIASCALVAFGRDRKSTLASFKYMVFSIVSGMLVLLGIVILYKTTGSLNIAYVAQELHKVPTRVSRFAFLLFLVGFGLKIGVAPFHLWLPDAHSQSPWPVSGLLSGLFITVGMYSFLRVFFTMFGLGMITAFGLQRILLLLGPLSIIVGHAGALPQKNIKMLLAFSTVAHAGYIMSAFGIATQTALVGGLFHILNHAIMKGALFLVCGILATSAGSKSIPDMRCAGASMPVYCAMFMIVAFSMIGIPPLNGFYSKLIIAGSGIAQGHTVVSSILVLGSFMSCLYYIRVASVFYIRIRDAEDRAFESRRFPLFASVPPFLLTCLCVALGVFPGGMSSWLSAAADAVLNRAQYIHLVVE